MTPEELDRFYDGSVRRLIGQLYAVTGDLAEARDHVQEAFVRAWDRGRRLEGVDNSEAWVRTVAVRLATSRWRRLRTGRRLDHLHAPSDRVADHGPEHVALVSALRRLPEAQRIALVLHHLCDVPCTRSSEGSFTGVAVVREGNVVVVLSFRAMGDPYEGQRPAWSNSQLTAALARAAGH